MHHLCMFRAIFWNVETRIPVKVCVSDLSIICGYCLPCLCGWKDSCSGMEENIRRIQSSRAYI